MLVKKAHGLGALLWFGLTIWSLVSVINAISQRNVFSTDILDFLPSLEQSDNLKKVNQQYSDFNNSQFVILITGKEAKDLARIADELTKRLKQTGYWLLSPAYLASRDLDVKALWQWYSNFSPVLLSPKDKAILAESKNQPIPYEDYAQQIALAYANPFAMSSSSIEDDPLFLLQNFLMANSAKGFNAQIQGKWPIIKKGDELGLVLVMETDRNIYDLNNNEALALSAYSERDRILNAYPDQQVHMAGAFLHVYQGSKQAKKEISTVGVGSLLAILLLFAWMFRSLIPFIASVLVLGAGLLVAFSLVLAIFGKVHLIAVVFCATVIGLGIDYTLHFFAHRQFDKSSIQTALDIAVPTGLGMITSMLAFLALALVPFPGFQQLAFMVSFGLFAVWISMVLWFPYLPGVAIKTHESNVLFENKTKALHVFASRISLQKPIVVLLGLCVVFLVSVWSLKPSDDIRQLQAQFKPLKHSEQVIQNWLQLRGETAYFVVTGDDEELVLQNMEHLCGLLRQYNHLILDKVECLSDWLPSQKMQRQNQQQLTSLVENGGDFWKNIEDLGLPSDVLYSYQKRLLQPLPKMTPKTFFNESASQRFAPLWQAESSIASAIVRVYGISDRQTLQHIAEMSPNVEWVDPVSQYSDLFKHFRKQSTLYVFGSYLGLLFLLSIRYGWNGAVHIVIPVMTAALAALCWLSVTGANFNLFSVLALILVAGVGIDYGIFLREDKQPSGRTLMAIFVSALTTMLAFGLLALSDTNAIHSFGVVILLGISVVLCSTIILYSFRRIY